MLLRRAMSVAVLAVALLAAAAAAEDVVWRQAVVSSAPLSFSLRGRSSIAHLACRTALGPTTEIGIAELPRAPAIAP
jgi:hypothetical protein